MFDKFLRRSPGQAVEIAMNTMRQEMADMQAAVVVAEDMARAVTRNLAVQVEQNIRLEATIATSDVPPRHRVCSVAIDPVRLTAQLRAIESSLRVEWEGTRFTVYSDGPIIDAQTNAVIMKMQFRVDLT